SAARVHRSGARGAGDARRTRGRVRRCARFARCTYAIDPAAVRDRGGGAGAGITFPRHPGMPWSDERVNRAIGMLLRIGVIAAAAVVLAGLMVYRVTGERAWIRAGLLILIATPVARVAFAAGAFALQRDWTYVAISTIVLALLIYGLS